MKVTVKLFAIIRDIVGASELTIQLSDHATASSVPDYLAQHYIPFREWKEVVRIAVNKEYVAGEHPLSEHDEVAIIPPVSGG